MKKQKRLLIGVGILIILFYTILLVAKSSSAPQAYHAPTLKADSLDSGRQLVDLRVDSLLVFSEKVRKHYDGVFTIDDKDSELQFICQSEQKGAFNRIFLNDASLNSFAILKNTNLQVDVENYRFVIPTYHYNGTRFAKLPAEIVQSMFLSIEP